MKIPTAYRQDTPEAIEPAAAPVWSQKPAPRKKKSEVPRVTELDPCDNCGGKFHPPLHILKYLATVRMWLCLTCRQDYTGEPDANS